MIRKKCSLHAYTVCRYDTVVKTDRKHYSNSPAPNFHVNNEKFSLAGKIRTPSCDKWIRTYVTQGTEVINEL